MPPLRQRIPYRTNHEPAQTRAADAQQAPPARRQPLDEVESALEQPTFADFSETPLASALEFLGVQRNIRIHLDQSGLAEAMCDRDQVVTFKMQGVRMALILDLLLEPLNLDYAVRENILFISSKERIRRLRETTVLRIGDVIPQGEEGVEAGIRESSR